jgi:outer membrane protein OmpA-like peptidoglycan-associated protein
MDAQERDFRARLKVPISRVGDDIVVVLRNDLLFRGMELTSDGSDLLERLSELLRHYDHTLVQIGAYTDTTGTDAQNVDVSSRRAKSVADALVADGVAAQRVASQGYGSAHLKIATGANVAEPRNRRIEIRIIAHPSAA